MPKTATKKKESNINWRSICGYKGPGASGKGTKKPPLSLGISNVKEPPFYDDVAMRALAVLYSGDSSDSEDEDDNPTFTTPMAAKCMEWRKRANELEKEVETNEKELRAANSRIRGLIKTNSHLELLLKYEQKRKEQFKAEVGKLKAEIDALKAVCPICQAEEVVATWVAGCGHRVSCDGCVSSMYKCDACPICREHMIVGNLVRLQGPGAEAGIFASL
jgi:hypothetical protein